MNVEKKNIENYEVEFFFENDILNINVTGTENSKSATAFIDFILNTAIDHNIRKVLIEENLEGKLSLFETFKVSLYAIKVMFSSNTPLKIALVDNTDSKSHEYKFGENIFFNRGIRFLSAENVQHAKNWLSD